MRTFCVLLFGLVVVTLAVETAKEKDEEYAMDIPEGLEFIEEEFIEPMAESDVADSEDIGSIEEPVELLSEREVKELEKDLAEIDVNP
ncbi:hypothetical protein ACHWQZ_G009417 [Mnemiopsis leidyi]